MVGYWPFNGNANDESGNGNNGTVNGAVLTTDRDGIANKAYSFDGINDFIEVLNNSNLQNVNSFSISIWYKINQWDQIGNNFWFATIEKPASYSLQLKKISLDSALAALTDIYHNEFNWNNLVITFSNNKQKTYSNGVLMDSITNSFNSSNHSIYFGKDPGGLIEYTNGSLDDIGFWNRALTHQEITALYNGCTTPTAVITPQSTTTFCQGGSVILNASTGSGYTYEWYKDGNIVNGSIGSSYTTNQSGSYTVKVINGSCNATSSSTTVTVNPNPTVSLSLANFIHIKESPVTLAGSPSGGTYSGAGVVGSTFSSTNAGLGKKAITYNYTTGAGCSGSATAITTVYDTTACSTFDTLFINIAVAGLTAPNNLETLKIRPNPANDHITIDNGNFSILNGYSVKIETVLGQEVFKSAINQQQFSVDLSTWKGKGIYLVHILDVQSNIIETKKIILQ